MADWRAVYENWDMIPEENKSLIESLMREKPKEKLAELFVREPYARMVYEKVVGTWRPPIQHELKDSSAFPEFQRSTEKEAQIKDTWITEKNPSISIRHTIIGNAAASLLPVASILSLLLAEISYYNPRLTSFLEAFMLLNLKVWGFLLALAFVFGLTSIANILMILSKGKTRSSDDRGRV